MESNKPFPAAPTSPGNTDTHQPHWWELASWHSSRHSTPSPEEAEVVFPGLKGGGEAKMASSSP